MWPRGEASTLLETIIAERPRRMMTAPSSRATRRLGSDVSATSARHSRVKTSTIAGMQNRRPSANASDRKPGLQRWLGSGGSAKGRRLVLTHLLQFDLLSN